MLFKNGTKENGAQKFGCNVRNKDYFTFKSRRLKNNIYPKVGNHLAF